MFIFGLFMSLLGYCYSYLQGFTMSDIVHRRLDTFVTVAFTMFLFLKTNSVLKGIKKWTLKCCVVVRDFLFGRLVPSYKINQLEKVKEKETLNMKKLEGQYEISLSKVKKIDEKLAKLKEIDTKQKAINAEIKDLTINLKNDSLPSQKQNFFTEYGKQQDNKQQDNEQEELKKPTINQEGKKGG